MVEQLVPFISRVQIKNYKSIARCDVRLEPLTVLVGPNGSGKSNFLDALAFLARAVATTPYEAVSERGGLSEILRRVPEPTDSFSIEVEATVPWPPKAERSMIATYGFEIGPSRRHQLRPFEVLHEACTVQMGETTWHYSVDHGAVNDPSLRPPKRTIEPDRLYLAAAGVERSYASVSSALASMTFYAFALGALRQPLPALPGAVLDHLGEHLGDVLGALEDVRPDVKARIDAYLGAIAPGVRGIGRYTAGGYVGVSLRVSGGPEAEDVEFGPEATSDGTIRAAAVLAALFQLAVLDGRISVVGIEEPEIALHPAAAGVLLDALTEASERVQVIVTTQSPDLLDRDDLDFSSIRAVSMESGLTQIGAVDQASRRIVRDNLYTLGELMRGNQLVPEPVRGDFVPRPTP